MVQILMTESVLCMYVKCPLQSDLIAIWIHNATCARTQRYTSVCAHFIDKILPFHSNKLWCGQIIFGAMLVQKGKSCHYEHMETTHLLLGGLVHIGLYLIIGCTSSN